MNLTRRTRAVTRRYRQINGRNRHRWRRPHTGNALNDLVNYAFRLDGTVVSLRNDGHDPPVLAVRVEGTPPSRLTIYLPLPLGALASAVMFWSGLALQSALRRHRAMQRALATYVEAQLR